MAPRTPSLADVFRRALETSASDLHVAIPARVERFEATKGLVDVKPLLKDVVTTEEGRNAVSVPRITNVPLVFPGAGGFRITFPVAVGDTCLLVFSDRSIDKWLAKGEETDPGDPRRHALSDAIAIPGIRAFSSPWTGLASEGITLGKDGGTQIAVKDEAIELGGGDEPVALANTLEQLLGDILSWLGSHTHPTGVGPSGTPTEFPTLPQIQPGELGSSVVSVKS